MLRLKIFIGFIRLLFIFAISIQLALEGLIVYRLEILVLQVWFYFLIKISILNGTEVELWWCVLGKKITLAKPEPSQSNKTLICYLLMIIPVLPVIFVIYFLAFLGFAG